MKKAMICLMLCSALFFVGCNGESQKESTSNNSTKVTSSDNTNSTEDQNNKENKEGEENKENDLNSSSSSSNTKTEKTTATTKNKITSTSGNSSVQIKDNKAESIYSEVKSYILSEQKKKPEAEKIKWSKVFLDKVDFAPLYDKYIKEGGNKNSVEDFALYISKNAPVQSNWKNLFEADFEQKYGQKVTKIKHLEGDLYQAYINIDGKDVPYVVVNSRTGYFHG